MISTWRFPIFRDKGTAGTKKIIDTLNGRMVKTTSKLPFWQESLDAFDKTII
jgi:hypothetical protein